MRGVHTKHNPRLFLSEGGAHVLPSVGTEQPIMKNESDAWATLEINVRYSHKLREMAGKREETVEIEERATLEDLLCLLSKKYGAEFERYAYSGLKEKGLPIVFLLDGKNMSQLNGPETTLHKGCTVTMMPPIAGG